MSKNNVKNITGGIFLNDEFNESNLFNTFDSAEISSVINHVRLETG